MNKKVLGILCALAIITSYGIFAQDSNTNSSNSDSNSPKSVPVEMELSIPEDEGTPYYAKEQGESFRGEDPDGDTASKNYLEDNSFKASENALNYVPKKEKVTKDKKAEEEPIIRWTVSNADGTGATSETTNEATRGIDFTDPGVYKVHNSGSRLLSDAGGATNGVGGPGEGTDPNNNGSGSGTNTANNTNTTASGPNGGGSSDAVTGVSPSGQVIPVKVHDVTVPDVWIAIEECVGSGFEETESKISDRMKDNMIACAGTPLVNSKDKVKDLQGTNYIFIDEGDEYKPSKEDMTKEEKEEEKDELIEKTAIRDSVFNKKKVRFTLAGNIFDETGKDTYKGGIVKTSIENQEELTQKAEIVAGNDKDEEGNEIFKGIFIRRNVPFVAMVRSIDNGDKRKSVGATEEDGVKCSIQDENGNDVGDEIDIKKLSSGALSHMFRVPNYPREQYADQPVYYLVAEVKDQAKNITYFKTPIYVINSTASFEGTTNR